MNIEEREIYFCKNYIAHNRTYWYLYPLLNFNSGLNNLMSSCGKANLYIGDEKCPYVLNSEEDIILVIKLKDIVRQDDITGLEYNIKKHKLFKNSYDAEKGYIAYIFRLEEECAKEIYKWYRKSQFSKMDVFVSKDKRYGDIFEDSKTKNDVYSQMVYHVIKKTKYIQDKIKSDYNVELDMKEYECGAILNLKEEIFRYDEQF